MTEAALHPKWVLAAGNFFFRYRNMLFPVVFAAVMLLTRPAEFMGSPKLDRFVMAAGAAIALAGQAFRLFTIGFAYIKRGGKNKQVYASNLVVAGLYAHSRNPMYVGNFLISCGVAIVYGSVWMYAVIIPFFAFVYYAIIAAEEQYLFGKFGPDYKDYMSRVNRFWPNFRGLRDSLAGYTYRWREVVSKEHGTLFGTTAGLVAIAAWKKTWIYGWDAEKENILRISYLLIPLVAFYVAVRILKRTGKLRDPSPVSD